LLVAGVTASTAFASSHREAPAISKDPTADNTDLYAFRSPDKPTTVTLISNWEPLLEPAGGPNFYAFDDKAVYQIIVDNVGDAEDHVVYQFYFTTHTRNGNTFLYNTGAVTTPGDRDLNVYQTYSVKKIVNGSSEWIGQDLAMQPNRVGPKSTPSISELGAEAVHKLSDGSRVFAGERDDPFFVDLGGVFDLLTIRKLPGDLGEGVDGLRGFNTMSIAIQVPITLLTKDGKTASTTKYPILGVYTTTERDGNGLHMVSIGNWSHRVLDNMRADYARLTWDDSGSALAVLRGMDRRGFAEKENSLIAFDKLSAESTPIVLGRQQLSGLPDSLVITVAERAAIESAVSGYNTVIAQQSQARGAALVDEFGLFDRLNRDGFVLGGTTYRTDYISGGLFSFDGVHPSALGSGILANAFITAINSRFGARIPVVDLSPLTNSQMALAAGR